MCRATLVSHRNRADASGFDSLTRSLARSHAYRETFNPALALRAVHLEKATAIHGVPTMFLAELSLLDALEAGDEVQHLSDLGGALDFSSLR